MKAPKFTQDEELLGHQLWMQVVKLGNGTPHRVGLSVFAQAAAIYAATLKMDHQEFIELMSGALKKAEAGPNKSKAGE